MGPSDGISGGVRETRAGLLTLLCQWYTLYAVLMCSVTLAEDKP